MSLINDALKRANQTQNQAAPPASPGAGLKPVERAARSPGGLSKVFAFLLVAAVLSGAAWFLWQGLRPGAGPTLTASSPAPAASSVVSKVAAPATQGSDQAHAVPAAPAGANTSAVVRPGSGLPGGTARASDASKLVSGEPNAPGAEVRASAPQAVPSAPPPPAAKPSGPGSAWPDLKLQAIFYRLQKPSVRLNGKILYVGDQIDGARLVGIYRESVKLELGGEARVVPLKQ